MRLLINDKKGISKHPKSYCIASLELAVSVVAQNVCSSSNGKIRLVETRGSKFEPWSGHLCCVLGQDTSLSQFFSPPRSVNGYW